MEHLGSHLARLVPKYFRRKDKEDRLKRAVASALQSCLHTTVKEQEITIIRGECVITGSASLKQAIFLHQKEILDILTKDIEHASLKVIR